MKRAIAAVLAVLALSAGGCARKTEEAPGWRAVAVAAAPAALGEAQAGALRFLGGVQLSSDDEAFGGLSDMSLAADGAFLAITDNGHWVRGRLALDETGAPTDVSDIEIAAMRNEDGAVLENKRNGDAEGMVVLPDGRVAVSFERRQIIRLYDLSSGPDAAAQAGPSLANVDTLGDNEGLEALAAFEDGRLLVGAEGVAGNGGLWIAPLDAAAPVPRRALYHLDLGYGLVDLDRLPDGDFIAVERFYAPGAGNRIRITKLATDSLDVQSGQARATELAFLQPPLSLDNFEGVSVIPQEDGSVRLYLVSDNNFSARQRTLIYAFEIPKPEEPAD